MVTEGHETEHWLIYLCYSEEDESCIQWLYKRFRQMKIAVWSRQAEILWGEPILWKVEEGLVESLFLLVIVSKQAAASQWVKLELEQKLLQEMDQHKITVLPATIDETKPESISKLLAGKYALPLPCYDSDAVFTTVMKHLDSHLRQRGLGELADALCQPNPPLQEAYPYGLVGGISPEYFIIPEAILKEITEDIINKKLSISLVAAPLLGKTSVLNFLHSVRYRDYYQQVYGSRFPLHSIYCNMQEFVRRGFPAFLRTTAQAIAVSLNTTFEATTYEETLEWIMMKVGRRSEPGPSWMILVDDFDYIVEMRELEKSYFDDLRTLGEQYRLHLVIASQQDVHTLRIPKTIKASAFFRLFLKELELTVWDIPTARTLVFHPMGHERSPFSEADFALLAHFTARHPLLMQVACEQLLKDDHAGEKTLRTQLYRRYADTTERVYSSYWQYVLTPEEKTWITTCWQTISHKDEDMNEELQALLKGEKNNRLMMHLERLGLLMRNVVAETETASPQEGAGATMTFPKSFEAFLRTITIRRR